MSKKQKTSTSEVNKIKLDDLPEVLTVEWLQKNNCKDIIRYLSIQKNQIETLHITKYITKDGFEQLTDNIDSKEFDKLDETEGEVPFKGYYALKEWPVIHEFLKDPEIQKTANKFYTKCLFKYLYDTYEGITMKHKWYDAVKKNSIRKNLLDDKINRMKDTLTKINEKKNNVIKHKKEMFVLSTVKIDEVKTELNTLQKNELDIQNFQYFTNVDIIDRGRPYPGFTPIRVFVKSNIKTLVIPDTVTEIGDNAFEKAKIKEIHLPNRLTEIGDNAFAESTLQSIIIPDSVSTIGVKAFLNSSIKKIKLPKSLEIIPEELCNTCALEDLEIPNSVIDINSYSFYNNNINKLTIGNKVEDIGFEAFAKNKITKLTIPNKVKYIYSYAFQNNVIDELTLGTTLVKIHSHAFANNKIKLLYIPNNVKLIEEQAFAKNKITMLTIAFGCEEIGSKAFHKNRLKFVYIPSSVTKLAADAFDPGVTIMKDPTNVAMTGSSNSLLEIKF